MKSHAATKQNALLRAASKLCRCFNASETAADLIEYALIASLIALGVVVGVSNLNCTVSCTYEQISMTVEKGRDQIPPGQLDKCLKSCR